MKNKHVQPGNVAVPDFSAAGLGADHDSYYLCGITTTGVDEVIKISRADGSVQILASKSAAGETISWGGPYVGTTYVYWITQEGLLRVNKHGGPIETVSSTRMLQVLLDDQSVWWVGTEENLYRRPQ